MATIEERIAQFQNMAEADPSNEMAHFSLGSAYLQMGRAAEAAASLEHCVELNPEMSKAYQLCGQAMIDAGWSDRAVIMLQKGYEIAASKGDLLPREAMADLLRSIGREPPQLSDEVVAQAEPLSMGWCLECHRNPTPHLRPKSEITNMAWNQMREGYDPHKDLDRSRQPNPPEHCSGCHR